MKHTIILLFIIITQESSASCSSQGPATPGSYSNNTGTGSISWGSMGNATASDNSYSTATFIALGTSSYYFYATDFGFSVPSYATLCGIEVTIEHSKSGITGTIKDNSVKIVKGGTISGTDHSSGASWTFGDASATYGNSGDAWGLSWTPAEVNASDFGIAVSASVSGILVNARIDLITITIHYDPTLPVELLYFSCKPVQKGVQAEWATATQTNCDHFTLQRSTDGISFQTITLINGSGTTCHARSYTYTDDRATEGVNYYRLTETDYDGHTEEFPAVCCRYTSSLASPLAYPNPAPSSSVLTLLLPSRGLSLKPLSIYLYNNSGALMLTQLVQPMKRSAELKCNLPTGLYHYCITDNDQLSYTGKISIE